MIQRDLKIGLVLGLILVVGVVIKLAMNPSLSPRARMMQLNNASGTQNKADSNNVSQKYILSDISLNSESSNPWQAQEDQLQNLFTPRQNQVLSQQESTRQKDVSQDNEEVVAKDTVPLVQEEESSTDESGSDNTLNEEPNVPIIIDYENAEKIVTERFHIVGKNETLSEISRLYYHSANKWQKIVDANPGLIKDPNKIKAGIKLIIPWE